MSYSFTIVGYGRIGQRHATIAANHSQSSLHAIIDIDQSKRDQAASDYTNASVYSNIDGFIQSDDQQTDIVCICTPNGLHASLAIAALQAGYHVVIEKPMALSKRECEQIIDASLKAGKQVFVVKQNRYSPPSKWLKGVVEHGHLGQLELINIHCFWNRDERYYTPRGWHGTKDMDGGTLFTQFSHFIDIMYWVFGDIQRGSVRANMRNLVHGDMIEFEDTGIVQFDFQNGAFGALEFTTGCWNQNMESSMTVIGSHGSLKIGGQYFNEVEYCHIQDYEMPELEPTNPPNDYGPYKGSAANHHFVYENVIDTLDGKATITANAMEGMKVVEIIEEMYAAVDHF
jgi:predicted dehydrogenase